MDIKSFTLSQLETLADDIRKKILSVVSTNGGHLSSNLGAVELSIAMHHVFNPPSDPFIFDVSHQSYTHKLLSGRWDKFDSLRKFGGISGYTKPSESEYDYFIAGHSSTSISLAVGAAKAIKLKNEDRLPVALIGDGALSAGMAYEALNELGDLKYPCVIILNDNEMSISKPIGAMSKYLSQMMAGPFYQKFKSRINQFLELMPDSAAYMAKRLEEGIRLITPGMFFEELGLEYIGPVNGHNIKDLISAFNVAKNMKKPVIVHVQTIKGKGYEIAEGPQEKWHGVSPFNPQNGISLKKSTQKSATEIFSNLLLEFASRYDNIVGVTAAMPSGTGLGALIERFPDRFWDTAIAEQHAVTSMAAMAKEGFKPYIAIYSTFMQRAYDQVIHDCAILNLPVVLCMDRAGIVGEDGETHQGAFDISFLNAVPNFSLVAPRDEAMFRQIMEFSYNFNSPLAIRYPRGNFGLCDEFEPVKIELGKSQILSQNDSDIAFIGYGNAVAKAFKTAEILNINPTIIDLIFIKPLDKDMLLNLAKTHKKWYIFSDSAKRGGVGEILAGFLQENGINGISITSFEYEDKFITHGATNLVEDSLDISVQKIAEKITLENSLKDKKY
ncbi:MULTISPECIES: 1-deoxy-D-xylulose-5-phosphate synthase [Campylobacter]|uniref:1-deoxy-D-xylulose-5-phosphate synthase n=1 Tax=Campylobacter TaxID=194 RepID=UPI000A34CADA|nr:MULTISPECIES: 1-deoxy-D-xylulose-5-phosphate synthase [unclassified Campylobacter]MCR8678865.1 1-deoxy-D-xylulose-5-phosphate synthase [Campylobacter sp. RM19072]MCR8695938.1 1-deoxy-D-xylulose-5-phosphate synthase [Campylobacter sp. RM19073]